jgi:hypothetical protein
MLKIKKELVENIIGYKNYLKKATHDAPIEVLCLPKAINTILKKNGLIRVFHLIDTDLTKIKGLGRSRIININTQLDKFMSA